MNRLIGFVLGLILLNGQALAGSVNMGYTPGSGVLFGMTTDGGGAYHSQATLCDFAACANGLGINSAGAITVEPGNVANTTPWLVTVYQGGSALSSGNPIFAQLTAGAAVIGAVTQSGTWTSNATIVGPLGTNSIAASVAVTSATSSLWTAAQGGAAITAANPLFSTISQGGAVLTAANPIFAANTALVGATQTAWHADPCQTQDWTYTPINLNTASTTTIIAGTSAKKTYICSIFLFVPAAVNIGIVEGTGTNCSSVSAGVIGGTTAATGVNLGANQGFVDNGGGHAVAATATNADNLCLAFSGAVQVSGNIITVQQ